MREVIEQFENVGVNLLQGCIRKLLVNGVAEQIHTLNALPQLLPDHSADIVQAVINFGFGREKHRTVRKIYPDD